MKKKNLREAFSELIIHAENARCKHLHHKKKHLHTSDQLCPVEYHLQHKANIVRQYMEDNLMD